MIVLILEPGNQRPILGEVEFTLPVGLQSLPEIACWQGDAKCRVRVFLKSIGLRVIETEAVFQNTIEGRPIRLAPCVQLIVPLRALQCRRGGRKRREIIPRKVQRRIDITGDQARIHGIAEMRAKFGRERPILIGVADPQTPWRQQFRRRHLRIRHIEMREIHIIAENRRRAAEPHHLVQRAEGAAFDQRLRLGRPLAAFRGDRDDAADGVSAIKAALRTPQYFDAVDIVRQQLTEIESAGRIAWIARIDTVDENLDLVRVRTPDEYRSLAARPARLHDIEARREA